MDLNCFLATEITDEKTMQKSLHKKSEQGDRHKFLFFTITVLILILFSETQSSTNLWFLISSKTKKDSMCEGTKVNQLCVYFAIISMVFIEGCKSIRTMLDLNPTLMTLLLMILAFDFGRAEIKKLTNGKFFVPGILNKLRFTEIFSCHFYSFSIMLDGAMYVELFPSLIPKLGNWQYFWLNSLQHFKLASFLRPTF